MIDLATVAVIGQLNDLARDYDSEGDAAARQRDMVAAVEFGQAASTLRLVGVLIRDETDGYDAAYGRVWLGAGRRLLFALTDRRINA
jgi:hypothetical protein